MYLAVFINADESVGDFAMVHSDGRVAYTGNGAKDLIDAAQKADGNQWRVFSLGGLDAFRRAQLACPDLIVTAQVMKHTDAAYDFLVDNGYPLSWESLFGSDTIPETATDAACKLVAWFSAAEKSGVIERTTMAGKQVFWPLVAHTDSTPSFRTVAAAMDTHKVSPPDQSWMTGDGVIDIAAETQWLQ